MDRRERLSVKAVEFSHDIRTKKTMGELTDYTKEHLETFGIRYLSVAEINPDPDAILPNINEYPEEWVPWLRKYMASDPILHAIMDFGQEPVVWSDVKARLGGNTLQTRIMNEAAECGLAEGVTFPITGKNGSLCAINFGGPVVETDTDALSALNLIGMSLYHAAHTLIRSRIVEEEGFAKITPRERECLQWVAMGESDYQIAYRLGVSYHTVVTHIRRAKAKLNASNRTEAVVKAARHHIIFL